MTHHGSDQSKLHSIGFLKEKFRVHTLSLLSLWCGTWVRFWDNKGRINEIDPYGWFQWYFGYCLCRRSPDDKRQINRWK